MKHTLIILTLLVAIGGNAFARRDDSGSKLASGMYFARLGGGSLTESRKFLWLR